MGSIFQREVGGRVFTFEIGRLAGQARGAVTVRYGDTMVLVTACVSDQPREGADFFPLTVDYEERLYAAGKIPGSFFRREGRPSQEATLVSRLTDRSLRPLFPIEFRRDVQVIVTVLSTDRENDPDVLAILGASAALGISDIPFGGPIAASRVGCVEGKYIINPTFTEMTRSSLEVVIVGTKDAVLMVEAGASEVANEALIEAIKVGQETNLGLIQLQEEMAAQHGKPKLPVPQLSERPVDLLASVEAFLGDRLPSAVFQNSVGERESALASLKSSLVDALSARFPAASLVSVLDEKVKSLVRSRILNEGIRPNGRGLGEIRPITCEVGILPRTHGSGLFTRGQTQVLTITTLGSPGEEQRIDGIGQEETKRFLHHYNFPPYSTGEVKRMVGPGRREVGHGALVERALFPVIPLEEEFPYTIRLVSEVVSSNGSTSMGSICASTLSLMDAGIPIKAPVAGVAMGLITGEGGKSVILTDIEGMEDHLGDMDFKVAGTAKGVTALQLDLKIKGVSFEVIGEALRQASQARLFILTKMAEAIPASRSQLSPYAPRLTRISIKPDKIGSVIGPGGKTIRSIIEETKATIDIEDDGTVVIGSSSEEATQKAIQIIESLTKEVEVGAIYTGKVTRTTAFGAFVEVLPGKEGLVHISELADYRVASVEDVVKIGDEIMVMVTEVDRMGRINLSRRAVLDRQREPGAAPAGAPQAGMPHRPTEDQSHRREVGPPPERRPNGGFPGRKPYTPQRGPTGGPPRDRGPRRGS